MRVRRLRKPAAHLEVTAFINVIVVLVPFLLSTAVFTRLSVMELTLPAQSSGVEQLKVDDLKLEIVIRPDALDVGDRWFGNFSAPEFQPRLDVTDEHMVGEYVEATGAVDILFNCAGWVHQGTLLECSLEDWDRSFDLNVRSMFVMTKAMLPKMAARGGGVILNMASVLGAHKAAPNRLAYAASKAAVVGFTRAVAAEAAPRGVTVNALCPGYVDTEMTEESVARIVDRAGLSEA